MLANSAQMLNRYYSPPLRPLALVASQTPWIKTLFTHLPHGQVRRRQTSRRVQALKIRTVHKLHWGNLLPLRHRRPPPPPLHWDSHLPEQPAFVALGVELTKQIEDSSFLTSTPLSLGPEVARRGRCQGQRWQRSTCRLHCSCHSTCRCCTRKLLSADKLRCTLGPQPRMGRTLVGGMITKTVW